MDIAGVLRLIDETRAEWAQGAVQTPDRERPEFAYGVACGRDQAAAYIRDRIVTKIEEEEDDSAES